MPGFHIRRSGVLFIYFPKEICVPMSAGGADGAIHFIEYDADTKNTGQLTAAPTD